MIGGEHKKERFSENITGEQNQPKNRGYLTGTQTKTGGYSSGTLQGNWSEERASAGYYDGKPLVGDAKWSTSYRDMTEKETPLEKLVTPKFDQNTLIDIENRTIQAFPGHQPHLDKEYSANTAQNFSTVYQTTYKPHQSTTNTEVAPHVPPVLGGTVGAQGRAVLLRVRAAVSAVSPGKSHYPGNVTRTVRKTLRDACTDKANSQINANELQEGFGRISIDISPPECVALIRHFDHKGAGTAFIDEMVNELRGELNDRRTQLVKSTYKMLQSLSSEHILRLSDMARLVDLTYCPSVMAGDCSVEDALADFEDAWAARDPNMLIQESAFSAFYGDVSFEFPLDNDFERFMRNTWHLSGGSGNCANVSCRKVEVIHLDGRVTTEEIKNDLAIKGEGEEIQELLVKNLASQGIKDVKKISVIKP